MFLLPLSPIQPVFQPLFQLRMRVDCACAAATLGGDLAPLLNKFACTECLELCAPKRVWCKECQKSDLTRRSIAAVEEVTVSVQLLLKSICEQLLKKAARSRQAKAGFAAQLQPCDVRMLLAMRFYIKSLLPQDGTTHVTQCVQLKGSRGGDKIEWEFKLITALAVDTLFVRCLPRQ
eukprot:6214034-Pleurochrysis_carterae.AAC.2